MSHSDNVSGINWLWVVRRLGFPTTDHRPPAFGRLLFLHCDHAHCAITLPDPTASHDLQWAGLYEIVFSLVKEDVNSLLRVSSST